MGGYPFRKANAFIGYLDRHSRRMSTLLATESMGYVEKVSGMWKGGGKHYDEPAGLRTDEEDNDDGLEERANSEARFRAHFALPEGEKLQAAYFGHLMRVLPLYGKIYIGDRHFCFRSLLPGTRTKLILPLRDIENVDKEKGFRFGYAGLVVVIRGHEELFFEFHKAEVRDDCTVTILQSLEATRYLRDSGLLDGAEAEEAQTAVAEHDALQRVRNDEFADHAVQLPREATCDSEAPTILFDDPKASFLNFKPATSLKITCLTIGSRGDVQPYIALCKKLLAEGHRPRIATHDEFRPWIESHGIEYAFVGGDPAELMELCIQNGTFTWAFLKEANAKMRGWLDELLVTAWTACQGSDLLIESPSAMAGIHIAEALGIPYFRAFTMPWTRTRAYPHAFIMPGQKMGGAYNYVTYVMFENVFWKTTAHQVNRWRRATLGLPNTSLEKLQTNKVPFLYNFSPYVVPPPLDYSDWIRVTGYWFLDEGGEQWTPPPELTAFIARARADGKKVVYVGFGSIIVPDPAKLTQDVIDGVLKADVRCILSKGWSDRSRSKKNAEGAAGEELEAAAPAAGEKRPEPVLPPEIFPIQSAPHDWLFRQVDAAAHHGGSGTTGASLRAGIPTIIRPFFGDQFFFGTRVEDLGVGICLKKWGANSFARALWEATNSERMIVKARVLGEQIRKVCRRLVVHPFFSLLLLCVSVFLCLCVADAWRTGKRRRHSRAVHLPRPRVRDQPDQVQGRQEPDAPRGGHGRRRRGRHGDRRVRLAGRPARRRRRRRGGELDVCRRRRRDYRRPLGRRRHEAHGARPEELRERRVSEEGAGQPGVGGRCGWGRDGVGCEAGVGFPGRGVLGVFELNELGCFFLGWLLSYPLPTYLRLHAAFLLLDWR